MAPHDDCFDPAAIPPELVSYVAEEASRDADRVIAFLDAVGLEATPERPRALPAGFLLDLGAALRALGWEQAGASVHIEAGLPSARDALRQAFRSLAPGPADRPGELGREVFRLSVERFAWNGRRDLRAEVVLDLPDEDALVEAMARFLWEHRHLAAGQEETQP